MATRPGQVYTDPANLADDRNTALNAHASENHVHAVIIGAGPYGLSLAAHFRQAGISFRVFGHPMSTWKTQMPIGMKLKSDGFASNLSAGSQSFTLGEFCKETGREYHDTQLPVPLEDFIAYGEEFAQRFVPTLEEQNISALEREADGFRLEVETGEVLHANHVVLAMGLSHFKYIPEFLLKLPRGLVSHTADHRSFEKFTNHSVTVVGRGASALNAAVLLTEAGADVALLSRSRKLHIHEFTSETRSRYQQLRHPLSPLGVGLRSWLACSIPDLYRMLPAFLRRAIVFKHLGPAGGTALQGRVDGRFPAMMGWSIKSVDLAENYKDSEPRIEVTLAGPGGQMRKHVTSHIIAGTGYRVDLTRLGFLPESLRNALRTENNGHPSLNRYFESSVPRLYFVGAASVANFGPLQRFAAGARFAATRITSRVVCNVASQAERNHSVVAVAPATQR